MSDRQKGDEPALSTYRGALEFLDRSIDYERSRDWSYTPAVLKLDRMRGLLDHLGHPERAFRAVHVAGTKGKGSTAALLESCLRQAGHTTGLFTSPHLLTPRERVRVDGEPIPATGKRGLALDQRAQYEKR